MNNEYDTFVGEVKPPVSGVIDPNVDMADAIGMGVNAFLGFVGGIAVIAVIVGAILWAMAAGDEEKIGKAKRILFSALIGLFLTLSAWGIVGIVIGFLVS